MTWSRELLQYLRGAKESRKDVFGGEIPYILLILLWLQVVEIPIQIDLSSEKCGLVYVSLESGALTAFFCSSQFCIPLHFSLCTICFY